MTTLEEVKRMQQQGLGDDQIIQNLRDKGIEYREIAEALAQSRIKAAVEQPDFDPNSTYGGAPQPMPPENPNTMEPSIMSQQPEILPPTPGAGYVPSPGQNYGSQTQEYDQSYADPYAGQQAGYTTSPDLTTEIAEQVVTEKLGEIRKHLEKVVDMKTTVEARIESIDERLKRIEKTIDLLQSSVLRKVGDYVTNVDDIKRELVETQKTFTKLMSPEKQPRHHHQHKHPHHK